MNTNAVIGSDATLNAWTRANREGLLVRLWIEDESAIITVEAWDGSEMVNREVKGSFPVREIHDALALYYKLGTQLNP